MIIIQEVKDMYDICKVCGLDTSETNRYTDCPDCGARFCTSRHMVQHQTRCATARVAMFFFVLAGVLIVLSALFM